MYTVDNLMFKTSNLLLYENLQNGDIITDIIKARPSYIVIIL